MPCACRSASSGERATLTFTKHRNFGVKRDLHFVHADRLDRAVEHDLALGDVRADTFERLGDVAGR